MIQNEQWGEQTNKTKLKLLKAQEPKHEPENKPKHNMETPQRKHETANTNENYTCH